MSVVPPKAKVRLGMGRHPGAIVEHGDPVELCIRSIRTTLKSLLCWNDVCRSAGARYIRRLSPPQSGGVRPNTAP
jgi:hypothetical protein